VLEEELARVRAESATAQVVLASLHRLHCGRAGDAISTAGKGRNYVRNGDFAEWEGDKAVGWCAAVAPCRTSAVAATTRRRALPTVRVRPSVRGVHRLVTERAPTIGHGVRRKEALVVTFRETCTVSWWMQAGAGRRLCN
jgi:hypothetical protein